MVIRGPRVAESTRFGETRKIVFAKLYSNQMNINKS